MAARAIATNGLNATLRGVLPLTGGTITGPLISTFSGTSAAVAVKLTGLFMSGGTVVTNKPHLLIEPSSVTSSGAWNSAGVGTALGINMPAATGFMFDFQVNGSNHMYYAPGTTDFGVGGSGTYTLNARSAGVYTKSVGAFGWSSSGAANGTSDTSIFRQAAGLVGTNGSLQLLVSSVVSAMAGGTLGAGLRFTNQVNFGVFPGAGAPSISAAQGSIYIRSDGSSTVTRAYIAINSGGVASSWTGLTTVA